MKRLIIFLLLVSYFVSSSVFAGNKDFNFRRFTAADGLSSNTVRVSCKINEDMYGLARTRD